MDKHYALDALFAGQLLELATEHARTSCNDKDLGNQHPHYPDGTPRCTRCALINYIRTGKHLGPTGRTEVEVIINVKHL